MQQRMMDEVTTCDFVVTNPTHIACAIKYDAQTMDSPVLVAKGTSKRRSPVPLGQGIFAFFGYMVDICSAFLYNG